MATLDNRSPEAVYATKPNIIVPKTHVDSLSDTITRAAQFPELLDDVDGGSGPQRTVTRAGLVVTDTFDGAIAAGQSLRKEA
jgi:hypothetical protein